jgi:hypothetical protein
MALKLNLTEQEKYGLSQEEVKLATKWLRQYKTAGVIPELEAAKLFELFLLGEPLVKLAQTFPQYPIGQIAFTAAYKQWPKDRDKMLHTLKDRVQAKVVKSVLDQVDFLTTMMGVANAEHLETMMKYCQDPVNNPKPSLRITTIKDYKEITETLLKIVSGATSGGSDAKKSSPMLAALTSHGDQRKLSAGSKQLPADTSTADEDTDISIMDIP